MYGLILKKHYPSYMHLIAEKWMLAHVELGLEKQGLDRLKGLLQEHGTGELLDIVYRQSLKLEGTQAAHDLMSLMMLNTPSIVAMTKRLESQWLLAQEAKDEYLAKDIKASLDLLKNRTGTLVRYTCSSCGFRARRFSGNVQAAINGMFILPSVAKG
jgi:lipopolysaccharide biosynthesis regulator YciM